MKIIWIKCKLFVATAFISWPGSVVGIGTGYGIEGPGIEFHTCPDRSWNPHSLLHNEQRVFPGVKSGRGVTLTPQSLVVPWSRKSRDIPLLPLWAVTPVQSLSVLQGCTILFYLHCV